MENINNIDGTERISEELASYLKRNKIKASDLNLKTLKRLNQVDMYISNKKGEIKNIINKLITCEFSTKDFTSVIGLNRTSIYKKNKTNDNNIVINYLTEKIGQANLELKSEMNHFIKQDDTSFVILNKFLDKEIDYQINVERLNQLNDELKSAIEMIDYLKKENKTLKNELIKQQESIKYTSDKSYNDGKNLN